MQLTLECPAAVIFRHRYQQFVLARLEMNGDLVVKTEHSERTIIPIRERILPRKNPLPVQVDDDVVAVTDFEKVLTPLRRRESRPGTLERKGCVANFLRRIRKLESRLTDANGLVPHSKEWFEHWYRKIDQMIAGDENVDLSGMTLEVIDAIIATGK